MLRRKTEIWAAFFEPDEDTVLPNDAGTDETYVAAEGMENVAAEGNSHFFETPFEPNDSDEIDDKIDESEEVSIDEADEFDDESDDVVDSSDDDGMTIASDISSSDDGLMGDRVDRVSLNNDKSSEDELDEQNVLLANNNIMSIIASSISLVMKVAAIAIFFKLPNTVVNAILALLRSLGHDAPKDARTI